jgi:putative phosphoribosyl transferase
VRKIGLPSHPEFAMGAVIDGGAPIIVRDPETMRFARISEQEFDRLCGEEIREIERRRAIYMGGRPPEPLEGRTAIVVDDGLATGSTMRAALQGARARKPARLIMAVPVAPAETLAALEPLVDGMVCLATPKPFVAVGNFYDNFAQVGDQEVISLLKSCRAAELTPADRP